MSYTPRNPNGQAAMAASEPVVIASDQSAVPVSGTVTANIGTIGTAATAANQTTIIGHLDGVEGILTTIDADTGNISTKIDTIAGAVTGTEMQVDVITMPTTTVQATNLDIRDLTFAADKVDASGTVLGAGANNIGDVDIASITAGDNTIGRFKLTDGTDVADVLDLANSNPLTVAIVNASGDQITSFGGTEYTEGDTDATITGSASMMEVSGNVLQPIQGSVADGLLVNLGTNNDVTVTGTITADAGTNLNTSLLALESGGNLAAILADTTNIETAVQLIDDTVATLGTTTYTETSTKGLIIGAVRRDADTTLVDTTNEVSPLQVDANGRLKVEAFSGETLPVSSTDLDIRNLVFATDKVDASGTTLGANSGVDIGDVTINNASGASAVNIQDGGNSITVDFGTPLFRGCTASFRTPGRAGTSGQKIAAIHNATGSSIVVKVRKIEVDMYCTVVKAITVPPPIVRIWKFTAVPTNGTALTKNKIGGSTTSSASCTLWGDASADGTGSGTTLTVTLPSGTIIAQATAQRTITAVGETDAFRTIFEFEDHVELQALEGLCVFLDYTAATSNPTTDMWFTNICWHETT